MTTGPHGAPAPRTPSARARRRALALCPRADRLGTRLSRADRPTARGGGERLRGRGPVARRRRSRAGSGRATACGTADRAAIVLARTRLEWTLLRLRAHVDRASCRCPCTRPATARGCRVRARDHVGGDASSSAEDRGPSVAKLAGSRPQLPDVRADRRVRRLPRRLLSLADVVGAVASSRWIGGDPVAERGRRRRGRRLHVHLHVRHDGPAEGLRDLARQLRAMAEHALGQSVLEPGGHAFSSCRSPTPSR